MAELRKTDYFRKVHDEIRQTSTSVDTQDLLRQFRAFDGAGTGTIKVYLLINVLKHNYPAIFGDECLVGLQFQLECLSGDGTVDYEDFTRIFLEDTAKSKPAQQIGLDSHGARLHARGDVNQRTAWRSSSSCAAT